MQIVSQKKAKSNHLFKLKTYHSLSQALSANGQNRNELNVFGTGSLANITSKQGIVSAISIDGITRKLFPTFRSVRTEIYLQSQLRKHIEEGDYQHKGYLLNRLPNIVQTFNLVAEFHVDRLTSNFNASRKQEIIRLINFLLKEEIINHYQLRKQSLTKEKISMELCGHPNLEVIRFYEIEYLNFLRMNLIHWLKGKGFQIEFYIPYNHDMPRTFKFWKGVYEVAAQEDISNCESIDNKKEVFGNRFGFFNENQFHSNIEDREDIDIIEFTSPADFKDYYRKNNDNVVSIDPDEVIRIIDNLQAPVYENNVGKFVYFIKKCKVKNGKIFMEFETMIELLTSSWIKTNNIFGENALPFLIDLRDYMYGVKTTKDVLDRLYRLQELDYISKAFDKENAQDTDQNYMKRYMLNPFRAFNYTHSERYGITINQLIELVKQLEKVCNNLILEEGHELNVNEYFSRWLHLLNSVPDNEHKLSWEKIFQEKFPSEWHFQTEELLALIYLLASNKSNKKTSISDISWLEELILKNNGERGIKGLHVTNITQQNFPEKHKTLTSDFFDYSELKDFINRSADKRHRKLLLHSLWVDFSVVENFEQLGTYQIYNVLAHYNGPITLSWIKHLKEENMKSVYLEIIGDLYNNEGITKYEQNISAGFNENMDNSRTSDKNLEEIDFGKIKHKIPDLYWLDHDFCSKKFFLTVFIEKQPIYNSEFHQQFIFSKVGKLFSHSDTAGDEFKEYIYPIFPHWTDTKKDNLIDTEYKTNLKSYKTFENITYPKEMKGLQILRSVNPANRRRKAKNQYRNDRTYNEQDLLRQFRENIGQFKVKAEPGNHCRMCPFLNNCNEGMYSIDHIGR